MNWPVNSKPNIDTNWPLHFGYEFTSVKTQFGYEFILYFGETLTVGGEALVLVSVGVRYMGQHVHTGKIFNIHKL